MVLIAAMTVNGVTLGHEGHQWRLWEHQLHQAVCHHRSDKDHGACHSRIRGSSIVVIDASPNFLLVISWKNLGFIYSRLGPIFLFRARQSVLVLEIRDSYGGHYRHE